MNAQTKVPRKRKGFFKGVLAEMKKVTWPTKKELINFEIVVLVFSLIATITIWIFDILFSTGISQLVSM